MEVADLLGPAPLLSTENADNFNLLLKKLVDALMLRDVIEMIYIRRFVCEAWTVERYSRHAAVAIERRDHESLQNQCAKLQLARKLKQNRSSFAHAAPADIAALATLEENMTSVDTDVDEILKRKASELDHNRALEKTIELQRQLDCLIASATRRRDDALLHLELYREGLGMRVKEATDRIVDGEFREVVVRPIDGEAPPLMASDGEAINNVQPAMRDADAG